ncbi:immunity 8 family protein [Enterobacteriaceae bacterium H18W14]|uniref:immunity 8 family protein n=1 Tax=Dryocola boscaweniae TaxID=2925397 RepID=UPI0022F0052C|nr:immunity 8 family protein [Dryocola boscaweniae]MCT4714503.1 immunity 8 family protein [Dryocola boscaweniae]
MKAILRGIWVDSPNFSMDNYQPEEKNCFTLLVNLKIGPENEVGTNYFYIHVCTPEWLCKHHWLPELMRHTLLVRKYDLDEITKTITDYIDQCEGNDWMDIAQKLSRVFAWEYEDYQP